MDTLNSILNNPASTQSQRHRARLRINTLNQQARNQRLEGVIGGVGDRAVNWIDDLWTDDAGADEVSPPPPPLAIGSGSGAGDFRIDLDTGATGDYQGPPDDVVSQLLGLEDLEAELLVRIGDRSAESSAATRNAARKDLTAIRAEKKKIEDVYGEPKGLSGWDIGLGLASIYPGGRLAGWAGRGLAATRLGGAAVKAGYRGVGKLAKKWRDLRGKPQPTTPSASAWGYGGRPIEALPGVRGREIVRTAGELAGRLPGQAAKKGWELVKEGGQWVWRNKYPTAIGLGAAAHFGWPEGTPSEEKLEAISDPNTLEARLDALRNAATDKDGDGDGAGDGVAPKVTEVAKAQTAQQKIDALFGDTYVGSSVPRYPGQQSSLPFITPQMRRWGMHTGLRLAAGSPEINRRALGSGLALAATEAAPQVAAEEKLRLDAEAARAKIAATDRATQAGAIASIYKTDMLREAYSAKQRMDPGDAKKIWDVVLEQPHDEAALEIANQFKGWLFGEEDLFGEEIRIPADYRGRGWQYIAGNDYSSVTDVYNELLRSFQLESFTDIAGRFSGDNPNITASRSALNTALLNPYSQGLGSGI